MSSRVVSVNISGPVLSLILYENINSSYEQEGFLLGTITTSITKSVTDDSREDIKIQDVINITGVLPLDIPHMYYKNSGELITEKLDDFIGKEKKNIVAWFKYNKFRKFGYKLTVRERVLHEELSKHFNIQSNLFTCLILTYGTTANKSTHIFQHAFINFSESRLKIIPMNIENLSNPCHQYQINTKPSDAFMQLYKSINKNQSELQIGSDIQKKLQNELKESIEKLIDSENALTKLQEEIKQLKTKVKSIEPTELSTEVPEIKEVRIEVPEDYQAISDTNDFEIIELKSSNDITDNRSEEEINTGSGIVDLTLTDDEDERPQRKVKTQPKPKTVKNKNTVHN